jgi:chromosome segregation protein
MFLKSIEIRGFKSFADKTDLAFKKGVTAVVGPNGSGKSNISDAVRWVLGEQSVKSLRGGKMEDVIFAGTQFRKAVGLSQVSLTLDNTEGDLPIDYSDITISRRLYRSGESEYYINNTQCRLRDIQELFMDTGIGKEGYSIIGQGKIDAILSGRPEERRSLLEEAAGIVKFKSRKEESEKKLYNTEQNLIRIGDILQTYEERLEPLRIDSEKANIFIELSVSLKEKEVNLIVHSIEGIQNKIDALKISKAELENDVNKFTLKRLEEKEALEKLNKELEDKDLEINNTQQEYYKNKSEYQSISAETILIEERLKNLDLFIKKTLEEVNLLQEKINSLQLFKTEQEETLQVYQSDQKNIDNNIELCQKEILELTSQLNEQEAAINKIKNEDTELLGNISSLKNSILVLSTEKLQLERKIEDLKVSCENYINSAKINSTTAHMLESNMGDINCIIKAHDDKIRINKLEISKLNSNLLKDERQLKELNVLANKLEANHQMLINLDKQYEGYNKAAKALMQNINNGKIPIALNNCFVVGEIITVKKDLETAFEIALGGGISDIITNDESLAKTLIGYLKTNNVGRATFLPLNIIKGKNIAGLDALKRASGFIGIASELVEYDSKFKNAIDYLLGRTIIATDMNAALSIAKLSNYTYKIVTLSGEVVNPGGSLTGGSTFHKSTSIIGRKREIEELNLSLDETNMLISGLIEKIENDKSIIRKLDENCLNLKDEIYYQNIELTKLQGKITAITEENSRITHSLTVSKEEIQLLKKKVQEICDELLDKNSFVDELTNKENMNLEKISEMQLSLKEINIKVVETKEKHTALKIKKAQLDEIVLSKIRELERLSNEIDEHNNKRILLHQEVSNSEINIKVSSESIKKNQEDLNSLAINLTRLEELLKENEVSRIKSKETIKVIGAGLESIALQLTKREDELHRHELSLAKLESEIEALYSKLNEELSLTYAEALAYKVDIDNMDSYKRQITKLKNQISDLGVVNVKAIEEYTEIKEKFTFMNSQKEDLIKAKLELTDMINEMTEKMKTVFSENLNKLKVIFNETFRELFKGGSADLILASGDELSANIEINVEPPGKKLQNINLMSGGEKVLSAIALLFSILKMKPTPFCILDEIEAALDDANVLRYADFLKKFSNNIQFIVITHRKGTMEVSDVLYGVTMEEKGVSKVVSVDLKKHPNVR